MLTWATGFNNISLGVLPREWHGLWGVISAPLAHGSWGHLLSNTPPLLVLGTLLLFGYPRSAAPAFLGIWIYVGQRRDEPARLLALTLILGGSAFTTAPFEEAPCEGPVPAALRAIVGSFHVDAFVAWYREHAV